MDLKDVTLSLDSTTAAALVGLAKQRGVSLDHAARDLLIEGLSNPVDSASQRADDLVEDFEKAQSWPELQGRLRLKGYDLRGMSGALHVVSYPGGGAEHTLADLGVEEAVLTQRIGRPFPGTELRWDWDRALDRPAWSTRPCLALRDQTAKG